MNQNSLSEAAALYLADMPVLEQTRTRLFDQLQELSNQILDSTRDQLEELAQAVGCKLGAWDNKSEPGSYTRSLNGDIDLRLELKNRDPRKTQGSYRLILSCSTQERSKVAKRQVASNHLEHLTMQAGIYPINWGNSSLWSELIPVDPNDLEATASTVSTRICEVYKVITDFVTWQMLNKETQ